MDSRGYAEGPFQLFIGIVVFGMALVIGAYLFNMVNCWKCDEMLKIEATDLREAITSIGKGDINSRSNVIIEIESLGSCAKGIFIRKVSAASAQSCRSFCPNHPNDCWVIMTESGCSGDFDVNCIDISGDTYLDMTDPDLFSSIKDPSNQWKDGSVGLLRTINVQIEKTGPAEITIGKPGSGL